MDVIKLIVNVFEKAKISVNNIPLDGKWKIIYGSNITSDWKRNDDIVELDNGIYKVSFSDVNGYIKPDDYLFYLNPGEIKQIQAVYTSNKNNQLKINFKIPKSCQKYLTWRLIQPQNKIVVDWNHELDYNKYLPEGNYQLQIKEYIPSISKNIQAYDYLTGDPVETDSTYISEENLDILLTASKIITRDYTSISTTYLCVSILPQEFNQLIKWYLVPQDKKRSNSALFVGGQTIQIPCGIYSLKTSDINDWNVSSEFGENNEIVIAEGNQLTLVGIQGKKNGNLRIKLINDSVVKNKGRWRIVDTETWYMDNEEISLPANSYEVEFKEIDNYQTPSNIFYFVEEDKVNIYSSTYIPLGTLQVNITENITLENFGDPTWKLKDDTVWKKSGEVLYLKEGTYTVNFNTVNNLFTHNDIEVIIVNQQSTIEEVTFFGVNLFTLPTKTGINFYNFNNLQKIDLIPQLLEVTDTNQIVFNSDNTLVAISNNQSPYLVMYDLINYNIYVDHDFVPPLGGCRSLDFSSDGKYLAVSHNNFPFLTVYNTSDWSTVNITTLPSNYCNCVKFSHNSNYLTVGFDADPYIIIYDTTTFIPINTILYVYSEVFSCRFNTTDLYLAVSCYNGISVYDIVNNFTNILDLNFNGTIYGIEFVNDYLIIISSLYFYVYQYHNISGTYQIDNKISIPIPNINNYIEVTEDQKYLIIGCSDDPYVIIYETTTWTQIPFTDTTLSYCKKFAISGSLSDRQFVNVPINVFPVTDYKGLKETDTLQGSVFHCYPGSPSDAHINSQWRLLDANDTLVYDSGLSTDLISHSLPSSFFESATVYKWQVRYKDVNLGWSFWSQPTTFITIYACVNKPANITPVDEINVIEQPVLTSSIFSALNDEDTQIFSQWRIYQLIDDEYKPIYDTGAITSFTSFTVPRGILIGSTETNTPVYSWKVRYKGEKLGWSDWSDSTIFSTSSWSIEKPVNTVPINNEIDIDETNTVLTATQFTPINCSDVHIASRFQIYDSNNLLIYQSGEIEDTRMETDIEFLIPVGILLDGNVTYSWRISYKGYSLGWTEWSDKTTFVTRNSQVSSILISITPSEILPGNSYPLRWRWIKSSSTTLYSDYIVPSETPVQISADQEIVIEFEPYVGLNTPSPITLSLVAGKTYSYNVNYVDLLGSIQCNITGTDLGRWRLLNTQVWSNTGDILTNLSYGVYTVEFLPVIGYITPENITNITVSSTNTIIENITYQVDYSQIYYLIVVIHNAAVGQQWKLASSSVWNDSGDKISLEGIVNDTIVFSDVPNYTTPDSIDFSVPDTYSEDPSVRYPLLANTFYYETISPQNNIGYIHCVCTPSDGKWCILNDDGTKGIWYNSDETIGVVEGTYTIAFRSIGGYETPENVIVMVEAGVVDEVPEFYVIQPNIGHLQVMLDNPDGRWRVQDTDDWNISGQIVNINTGRHIVEFADLGGYIKPSNKNITITENNLLTLTEFYVMIDKNPIFINIIINPDHLNINTSIQYRIRYSHDSIIWNNWTAWIPYFSSNNNGVVNLNNKISNPINGYYEFQFTDVLDYKLVKANKVLQYQGETTNITFDYISNITPITSVNNYGVVNLNYTLIDSMKNKINSQELVDNLSFQHAIISDDIFENRLGPSIVWDGIWVPAEYFSSTYCTLDTKVKHAFKVAPINGYFNLDSTGNTYYIDFSNEKQVNLNLNFQQYELTNLMFTIFFTTSDGFPINIVNCTQQQITSMESIKDFSINIRTKAEYEDTFSTDSKSILMHSMVANLDVGGLICKSLISDEYSILSLFGTNRLGYISIESFDLNVINFNAKIRTSVNPSYVIGLNGKYPIATLVYTGI